jgi:transcriptional regulator with XRE-family HTH domain
MAPSRKSVHKTSRKASKAAGRGPLLKRIRKLEKTIGQKNLASFLGVSARSVRRYKQGTRRPIPSVLLRLRRIERVSKGLRKTKSIKRKGVRKAKIEREHPEVTYFEARKDYDIAKTEHIELIDIHLEDVPGLIEYLEYEGCAVAYFIVNGTEGRKEVHYSSEAALLSDFKEGWRGILRDVMDRYDFILKTIDLIGIISHAPSPEEGS